MRQLVDAEAPLASQAMRDILNGSSYKKAVVYAGSGLTYGSGLDNFIKDVIPDLIIKIELP